MTVEDVSNASKWLACIYAIRREGPYIVTFAETYEEMDSLRKRAVRVLPGDGGIAQPALIVWYPGAEMKTLLLLWSTRSTI